MGRKRNIDNKKKRKEKRKIDEGRTEWMGEGRNNWRFNNKLTFSFCPWVFVDIRKTLSTEISGVYFVGSEAVLIYYARVALKEKHIDDDDDDDDQYHDHDYSLLAIVQHGVKEIDVLFEKGKQ